MEKIEVGYRNIGSMGGVEYYHKFLIYTDSNGNQYTISGWTGNDVNLTSPFGHMNVELDLPYNQTNPDHPDFSEKNKQQKQYREPITKGEDLSDVWNGMLEDALSKDDIYPYDPLRQNSNSLTDALLKDAGLNAPEDDNLLNPFDHWTPAADKKLDKDLVPINPLSSPLDALEEKLGDWLENMLGDMLKDAQGLLGGAAWGIADALSDLFNSAQMWVPGRSDPLVFDLDGDGVETLNVSSANHILFDYDSDGIKTATGWVVPDDAFLVIDRNANGTIDNGSELFGDQTIVNGVKATDGFAALSAEDTNNNGIFDINDTNFNNVRLWQDLNQNGISEANELFTLETMNVRSINLTAEEAGWIINGNTHTHTGTYTKNHFERMMA